MGQKWRNVNALISNYLLTTTFSIAYKQIIGVILPDQHINPSWVYMLIWLYELIIMKGATDSVKPLSQLPAMRCKTQFGIASVWLTGFTMYVASFIIV